LKFQHSPSKISPFWLVGPFNAQLVPRAMLICIPNGMVPVPEPLETQIDAIRTLGRLGGQDERAAALETGRDEPQRRWRQLKLALLVRCDPSTYGLACAAFKRALRRRSRLPWAVVRLPWQYAQRCQPNQTSEPYGARGPCFPAREGAHAPRRYGRAS
jgi:hypothetical protein